MKTVAIVGASSNRAKYGNIAVRAFRTAGYKVIPINPNEAEVEGLRTYASVLDVPETIHMATVYVPPDVGERVIEDIAKKGISEVWLNPGAGSRQLVAKARALGLKPIESCSILGIGLSPSQFF